MMPPASLPQSTTTPAPAAPIQTCQTIRKHHPGCFLTHLPVSPKDSVRFFALCRQIQLPLHLVLMDRQLQDNRRSGPQTAVGRQRSPVPCNYLPRHADTGADPIILPVLGCVQGSPLQNPLEIGRRNAMARVRNADLDVRPDQPSRQGHNTAPRRGQDGVLHQRRQGLPDQQSTTLHCGRRFGLIKDDANLAVARLGAVGREDLSQKRAKFDAL